MTFRQRGKMFHGIGLQTVRVFTLSKKLISEKCILLLFDPTKAIVLT